MEHFQRKEKGKKNMEKCLTGTSIKQAENQLERLCLLLLEKSQLSD